MRAAFAVLAGLMLVASATAGSGLVFAGDPGVILHGSIRADVGASLDAADATTRNQTGIGYLVGRTPTGAARWITLDQRTGAVVPFTIRVPRAAAPGQYFAGIVVGTAGDKQRIVGIEIDVSGPLLAHFVLGAVHVGSAHRHQQLYLRVSNTGNVARRPQGVVSIQTRGGTTLERLAVRMATLLPGTAVDYPLRLREQLRPGTYTAAVRLTYPGAGGEDAVASSAAPQFNVSAVLHRFRPRPSRTPAAPVAAKRASPSWPWFAGGAATLLAAATAAALVLRRRRPVTVTVTPLRSTAATARTDRCEGFHYWDVDWQHPEPGPGGSLTYPHRCRRCGLEVRAADIAEAAAKAAEAR
jgi:hypothetical protein